jgi:hypothetical protein
LVQGELSSTEFVIIKGLSCFHWKRTKINPQKSTVDTR